MCKKMIFLMSLMLMLSLVGNVQAYFDTWTSMGTPSSGGTWYGVAMSADGTIQTAIAFNGPPYVSTDSGNTWTASGPSAGWVSVAMSADGRIQAAVSKGAAGKLIVSTDWGNTWTVKVSDIFWDSVAMSGDGTIQAAIALYEPNPMYVSTDSGNTWTAKESTINWNSVAMSADGTIQTATGGGRIYVSTDTGNTWTATGPSESWRAVAMSPDGTMRTAVTGGDGQIYVSTDSGNTWTATGPSEDLSGVAISSDGTIQTAIASYGHIYVSTDTGNTWRAELTEENRNWRGIAMSADGCIQTAVAYAGDMFVCSEDPVEFMLNPIPANGSTVSVALNQLQWTLPEPNNPGDEVLCDVHFGTIGDPNVWDNPKIVDMQHVESVAITVAADTTYYWAIRIYDPSMEPRWTPLLEFSVVPNVAPIVNAGDDLKTWLVDELPIPVDAESVVQLNGTVTDDGQLEPYTVLWTVLSEPDAASNPAAISDSSIVNPTITMTLPGWYELELAADDGEFTVSDTMVIRLYDTSCTHAQYEEGFAWLAGDINHDCKVNLLDIGEIALTWLEENYSTE